jgi:hypothetical protein
MKPHLLPKPQPPVYAVADEARALLSHPNPNHAAKWLEAVKWLRRGKVSEWRVDNPSQRLPEPL